MLKKRNAIVGWLVIVLGRRMTQRIVRRRLRALLATFDAAPRPRSRRLPVMAAAVAAAAAAAVLVTRQRH